MVATIVILAFISALAPAAALAWRGMGARRARAVMSAGGWQEARMTVKKGYRPDVIQVVEGVPVRLRIERRENDPCSDRVVFSAFGVDRRLPPFQETVLEFLPDRPGAYLFTCEFGMYRGKLLVAPRKGLRQRKKLTAGAAADGSGVREQGRRGALRSRFSLPPVALTAALWLCTLPVLLVLAPRFIGWSATWHLAGVVLVAELLLCWSLCRGRLEKTGQGMPERRD